ncbi:hypothetical protein [Paractinoplanes maris]|uniref:hypothetical protein n=1 Tax=Paractinoplanes maris TaxID=1734446 RepID=UPI002020186E|nr:hypothetical protein [Actinoplanes maris]
MPKEGWIAVLAAGTSLLVALITAVLTWRTQRRVAELTHRLQEQRAERDARRDYEYDAKKRLYAECEPVIFEAMELAETFRRRVLSLARAAANGGLAEDGSGWLAGNGYYFRSTAYYLLAPSTSVKLLQRRLTEIDLALEPRIAFQYLLLKEIFHSYTWDHDLARVDPAQPYEPDAVVAGAVAAAAPQRYRRQGLYLGVLDQIADELTIRSDNAYHCKSLGEFWAEFERPDEKLGRRSTDITEFLSGFHPGRAPVLWRLLVSQYLLFGALLRTREGRPGSVDDTAGLLVTPDEALAEGLDWRGAGSPLPIDRVRTPVLVGHEYVRARLAYLAAQARR